MAAKPEVSDIRDRTLKLAVRILKMLKHLPKDTSGQVVARQIAKSGTSIGANVEEAHGSHSKAEFSRRMGIARSEARETLYWLRLIVETALIPASRMKELTKETNEIVSILTTIVKKTRRN